MQIVLEIAGFSDAINRIPVADMFCIFATFQDLSLPIRYKTGQLAGMRGKVLFSLLVITDYCMTY